MHDFAKTGAMSDHFQTTAAVGRDLQAFAAEMGVELAPLAWALEIDPDDLQRMEVRISLDRFCRLLETLAAITGDDTFGLKYGYYFRPGGSGPFGYGLKAAPDLRAALDFTVRHVRVTADISYLSLEIDYRRARFEWAYSPMIALCDQYQDFGVGLFVQHFKHFCGPNWLPSSLELRRRAPRSRALHRKLASPNTVFGAPLNVMEISADALDRPNPDADPILFEMMGAQCEQLLAAQPETAGLDFRVKEEVLAILGEHAPTAARIGRRLGLSERSLQRRLAEIGTRFQTLVDDVRRELSDRLLLDSDIAISEISYRLGFSAPSAYTRSAMRWYGATPSAVRERGAPGAPTST